MNARNDKLTGLGLESLRNVLRSPPASISSTMNLGLVLKHTPRSITTF